MPPKRALGGSASPSPGRAQDEVNLKLLCVGAASTGKSTFLKFWETKESHQGIRTTIQMEFHKQEMDVALPPPYGLPSPPAATQPSEDRDTNAVSSSFTNVGASSGLLRENSSVVQPSETKRTMSAMAPFRLTVPEIRTNFGPGTELRRAIVKVWDIQGQESTKMMTRIFYTGAVGALVFCELQSSSDSLDSAVLWKHDIDSKVRVVRNDGSGDQPIPCWLVVNKYDLVKDLPPTSCPSWASRSMLDAFVATHGFVGWSYAAGLKGVNVPETVAALVSKCVERFPEEIRALAAASPAQGNGGVHLQRTRRVPKPNNSCCNRN